jgi:hypothetical protein
MPGYRNVAPDPQEAPDVDECPGCGLDHDHEPYEECDPADVAVHVEEMRWAERMAEEGL